VTSTDPADREQPSPSRVHALTSTVSGYAVGVALTAVAGLIAAALLTFVSMPLTARLTAIAAALLAALVCAVLPARLSVGVSRDGVRYRRGTGQARWIPVEAIATVEAVHVGYGALVGLGIRPTLATDRRIVRPGWALHLRLRSREEVWLSTRDPLDASAVLAPPTAASTTSTREDHTP